MKSKRAQGSTEVIVTVVVSLIVIIILIALTHAIGWWNTEIGVPLQNSLES